jgi:hypothetical protein
MTGRLAALIADEGRRRALGEAARATILKGYLWSRNAEKILEIIEHERACARSAARGQRNDHEPQPAAGALDL